MRLFLCAAAAFAPAVLYGATPGTAADGGMPAVSVDAAAKPARLLSEYHLFKDNARQIPNDRLVPYDLNTPLFSDYTEKYRFIWLPPGTSATYDAVEAFSFPVGTVIVKTFAFLNDIRDASKGQRIIETRLLINTADKGWVGLPYIWADDLSDARLAVAGGTADVTWTHYDGTERTINYIIPNMNQCKQCHENSGAMLPIGPKARHLNKDFAYDSGVENQLAHWEQIGYLRGAPADPDDAPRCAQWDQPETGTLDARARAWLDINCAHCHNPNGPAYTSGLDLSYGQRDPMRIGVMKPPVAAGQGAGDFKYSIVPGNPDASILVYRIESTDPGVMMPQLPRRVVHDEGVALIREWISAMPPAP